MKSSVGLRKCRPAGTSHVFGRFGARNMRFGPRRSDKRAGNRSPARNRVPAFFFHFYFFTACLPSASACISVRVKKSMTTC